MTLTIRSRGALAPSGCGSVVGRLVGSLFFLVFLAAGLVALAFLGRAVVDEAATYRWPATACVIAGSTVAEQGGDSPYVPRVTYRYVVAGRELTGDRIRLTASSSSSYSDAQEVVDRYPVGAAATCRVDPADPSRAILEHSPPWMALILLVPLVFVAVGGGGLVVVWRRRQVGDPARPTSLARQASGAGTTVAALLFGGFFVAAGGVAFAFMFVVPMSRLVAARSWVETSCTVISSTVRSHASDDGTTYSVAILYEYRVEGRPYRSDRYRFTDWSSSGHAAKQAVVDRHPPGTKAVCFVDPAAPSRAVLERSFHPSYLLGLFPLLFVVAGSGVLVWAVRSRRAGPATAAGAARPAPSAAVSSSGQLQLEPAAGPWAKLVGMTFVCLFWNGIVSVFLWQLISAWQRGDREWGLALFLTPFVLVGLGLVGGVAYTFLALFNPRPHLSLATSHLRLGDRVELAWRFSGRASRIRRLVISFTGQEEATYRRGTDSHTDRQVFHRAVLVDTTLASEIERGSRQLELPSDSMHSVAASHNKIVWKVEVTGDIANWPDVGDSYEVTVHPHRPGESV